VIKTAKAALFTLNESRNCINKKLLTTPTRGGATGPGLTGKIDLRNYQTNKQNKFELGSVLPPRFNMSKINKQTSFKTLKIMGTDYS